MIKDMISPSPRAFAPLKGELTAKLVTPGKMILFWEVSELPKKMTELFFNYKFDNLVTVVRIYDVTDIIFNGKNARHFYEITVPYQSGHWFIKGLSPNHSYTAELGVHFPEANFFPLFRSNCIQTTKSALLSGIEIKRDLIQYQQYEDHPPKWLDYVSTYSYYLESNLLEKKNG